MVEELFRITSWSLISIFLSDVNVVRWMRIDRKGTVTHTSVQAGNGGDLTASHICVSCPHL